MMALFKDRMSAMLLTCAMLAHLLLALGFHLSVDEAHYALYASHLDWSYFDHPPLVGWLQWPGLMLGGSDVLMRIVPMACWAGAALGVVRLTGALYPQGGRHTLYLARAALLLLVLSPMPHLLGLALVPDTLLMPITCAVMLVCWRLCDATQATQVRRLPLWLGLGLGLGLAGLSKYTAVMLALGAALVLLLAHGPGLLKLPGPWVAVLLAGALISPVLGWNATHGWISFAYQVGHVAGADAWRLSRVVAYGLVQVIVFGLLLLVGWVSAWRSRRSGAGVVPAPVPAAVISPVSPLLFCACFGVPSLLLFAFLSGRGSALPHWTAPGWLALMPVAAAGCVALWQRHRTMLIVLGVVQALTFVTLAGLMLTGGVASETGAQARSQPGQMLDTAPVNPFADLYGWDAAGVRGRALAQAHGVPALAVMNWTLANRIAWYARPVPVKVVNRHFDQFDLWFGTLKPGESVVLIDWSLMSFVPPVGPRQFERCDPLEQLPTKHLGRQMAHFNYLLCRNWQGPLEPPLGSAN